MNTQSLTNMVQIVTGLAVVVGLALVIWELQQTRDVVFAQLTSDGYGDVTQHQMTLLGESASDVVAKACDDPDALTTSDLMVLESYFSAIINRMRRNISIADRTGFYSDQDQYRLNWTGNFLLLFETSAGRVWWEKDYLGNDTQALFKYDPRLQEFGDEILTERSPGSCTSYYSNFKAAILAAQD